MVVNYVMDQSKSKQRIRYYKDDSRDYQVRRHALAKFIYGSGRPISMADDIGLQELLAVYSKRMPTVSSRQVVLTGQQLVAKKLVKIQQQVKDQLQQGVKPSLTTDIWSSRKGEAFISATLHLLDSNFNVKTYSLGAVPFDNPSHTGDNIAKVLLSILSNTLNIKDFAPVITSDSAANMIKGISLMPGCFWIPCALHCIHNAVKAGIDAVDIEYQFFDKVKTFVRLIQTSPKQAGIFRKCQVIILEQLKKKLNQKPGEDVQVEEDINEDSIDNELLQMYAPSDEIVSEDVVPQAELDKQPDKVLSLVKHVDVRWSSMYGMLVRFHQLKDSVKLFIQKVQKGSDKEAKIKLEDMVLNGQDWVDLEDVINILKPIKNAQIYLEASDTPRFHVAGRTILKLLYTEPALQQFKDNLQGKFCTAFKDKLIHFFDNVSLLLEYGIAAFLDPRQQSLGRFKYVWDVPPGCPKMELVLKEWPTKEKFLKEVIEQTIENCKSCLTQGEKENIEQMRVSQCGSSTVQPAAKKQKVQHSNLSDEEDHNFVDQSTVDNFVHPVVQEVNMYKNLTFQSFIQSNSDGTELDWWKLASVRLPYLSRLVRWSWSVQCSSASSERSFSKAGYINNRYRQSQLPGTLWKCTLLVEPQRD